MLKLFIINVFVLILLSVNLPYILIKKTCDDLFGNSVYPSISLLSLFLRSSEENKNSGNSENEYLIEITKIYFD